MSFAPEYLWLIPVLPLIAAGVGALLKQAQRKLAAGLAIGAMGVSFLLSCIAFLATLQTPAGSAVFRDVFNFPWFDIGETSLRLGFILDPLTAIMLVMVTFVGLLIFIYSVGYMAHDENFTRFFCFLALFAAAMLGIIIANNLLLLFISWELVGLASYLLIGFWYHKPSAAAAAKKAFITTRIGDIGFFIGILWLYAETGTLLFYDNGNGCLESSALTQLVTGTTLGGMALSTAIALLIFCGAMGKSGQVPLHVWLPDAMEGPTPVSALIHAATMVAAGVFMVARVFPLFSADSEVIRVINGHDALNANTVVTWVGAITAVFAACIAVAQNDIKRILAYSTVSQLGYMMMGLGMGGVAVGMFHLITHAFFKALLFLGSGSVIHGCHEEQDIRKMGGLRKFMPLTFATYAVGMLALAGFPLLFSGFWSKDEILHAAHSWPKSQIPFYLGVIGAFLTAFYMTRQVCYVFFGKYRGTNAGGPHDHHANEPHESPRVMTVPLAILAIFALLLGFVGTPAWPWFQEYLSGDHTSSGFSSGVLVLMGLSAVVSVSGIALGWWIYSKATAATVLEVDPLEKLQPAAFNLLRNKFYIDELYEATVIKLNAALAVFSDWLDRVVWGGAVKLVSALTIGFSWFNRTVDEDLVNLGFDQGCSGVRDSSGFFSRLQNGQVQNYLRYIGVALVALLLVLIWGFR
jgi:NADH-quinone oxidoreductase subunit L